MKLHEKAATDDPLLCNPPDPLSVKGGDYICAAIPAVIAYNRFAHDVDRLAVRFESFMEEFSNILQRQTR